MTGFIDIHGHAYRQVGAPNPRFDDEPQWFMIRDEVLNRHRELGIERGVLLPIVNAEVYLPQSNEDILDMADETEGHFIPFCNIDPRVATNDSSARIDRLLHYYRDRGCKGVGEVMPNLRFLDPRVQNLFRHVEAAGLPLTFDGSVHIGGGYGLVDDPGMPELEASLKRFPQLKIFGHGPPFWAEIGRLRTPLDRAGYPAYPIEEEGVVPKLLRRYEHLYGDLSAMSGFKALTRDRAYAISFLTEFQDKLLFGTDLVRPDQDAPLPQFLNDLRDSGDISQQIYAKIARGNAIRILDL